ncbi:MAG: HAMP domain-containing protein [Rhodocyclales bacterium]|nr:HAMP domain-containing protein [Rhodocyclales bacterium]
MLRLRDINFRYGIPRRGEQPGPTPAPAVFRLRDLSFRHKIPLRGSLLVVITAVVVTGSLIYREYEELKGDLVATSRSMGRVLAKTLVTPLLHDDVWRAYEIVNSPFRATGRDSNPQMAEVVVVLDRRQQVYVSTHPPQYPMLTDPARANPDFNRMQRALAEYKEFEATTVEMPGSDKLYVLTPIVSDGVLLGTLVMGYSKSAFLPRFFSIALRAGLVTLLVLAVLLPASWYWAQRFARPLVDLAESMGKVGATIPGDAEIKLEQSRDEIGQLGAAFKAMLEQLREKESLEKEVVLTERLAALGRLAAGIAHEINNPLGGMLNALSTFKRHGNDDPLTAKTLSLIERGLLQIKDTVSALLVEAKVRSRPLAPQDIEDTHTLVLADARQKSARFDWKNEVAEPLPLPSTLVRQILINLMLNAVEAVDRGGRVSCRVAVNSGRLHVVVGNDGAFIPQERMEHLFEPFATGRESGHGLGLWVTYQIVRQLNGEITAESEPGQTRFTVSLPIPDGTI